ncbi:tetratricopeptide repeat protein, partial [Akkermansia sp. NBRC 115031]|uniref:tetratricopeptide repeat protein n=1 Tax=Akkermansia sp. NBRC 115031 TaxID=2994522 RepID=UPI00255769D2
RAATLGDPEAQFEIANTFQSIGDRKSAVTWLMKAAEQGFTRAQINLGYCYETGDGVAKDLDKSAEWYNKAANLGNGEAKYLLNKLKEQQR